MQGHMRSPTKKNDLQGNNLLWCSQCCSLTEGTRTHEVPTVFHLQNLPWAHCPGPLHLWRFGCGTGTRASGSSFWGLAQTTWAQWMHPRQRCCTSEESSRCCSPGLLRSACEPPHLPQTPCWFAWPSKRGTRRSHRDHHALEVHSMATSAIRCLGWTPRPQNQDKPSFQFSECWEPRPACPLHTVWRWRHSCRALSARLSLCRMVRAESPVQSACGWPHPWRTWSSGCRSCAACSLWSRRAQTFEHRRPFCWVSTRPWESYCDGDFVFNSIVHGELDLCSLHAGDGGPLLATHHRRPRAESHGFHQLTWVFQLAAGVVLQLPRQLQTRRRLARERKRRFSSSSEYGSRKK